MARYIHPIKINEKIVYRCFISATDSYFLSTTPDGIEPMFDSLELCLKHIVDDLFRARKLQASRDNFIESQKRLVEQTQPMDLDAFIALVELGEIRKCLPNLDEAEERLFHQAKEYLERERAIGSPQPSTVFDFALLVKVVNRHLGVQSYVEAIPQNEGERILFEALDYLRYIENTYVEPNVKFPG